jgi:hypothetical protein
MTTIEIVLWIQKGIAYVLDPEHRLVAIGLAIFVLLALGRYIFRGIKLILFIGIIFLVIYFGIKYLATPIQ